MSVFESLAAVILCLRLNLEELNFEVGVNGDAREGVLRLCTNLEELNLEVGVSEKITKVYVS